MTATRPSPPNHIIEYVGGPKDGERAFLMRSSPKHKFVYPMEIPMNVVDEANIERLIGRYTRDSEKDPGVMRYLWSHRGLHRRAKGDT